MSESPTFRLDQAAPASQYGETFNVPTTPVQPEAENFLDDSSANVAQATSEVRQAYEAVQSDERLVFTDGRRGSFEVRQQQPEQVASTINTNTMLDDSYAEMVRARQEAAAKQAEHDALEAQNVQAIASTGQIVEASREYAEKYGLAA